VCTAATAPQLFDALAAETKAWFKKLPPALQELRRDSGRAHLPQGRAGRLVHLVSHVEGRIAGSDGRRALVRLRAADRDEASGVPDPVFESSKGSMAAQNAVMVLAGNPVRTSGLFFDTHHKLRDRWLTFHISSAGHPRVTPDFLEDMKAEFGEDSNAYRVRVLGEFPTGDEDTVIPFELMEAALHRDVRPLHVRPIWGVDCARFGNDTSALAKRVGNALNVPSRRRRAGTRCGSRGG
jgi:phage terminase large subunit